MKALLYNWTKILIGICVFTYPFMLVQTFAQQPEDGDVFELSPFEVDVAGDQGYEAQNTLAGTRLNTSIRDLGITITALTQEFWEDTAVSSVNDMLIFTPGAERSDTQVNDTNARTQYWGDNTRFRGVQIENIVRNQFRTNIPSDTYNASRFEFSRGTNAVLFGVTRETAGSINRTTQDAIFRDDYLYRNRIDQHGSMRHELNVNQELMDDKLAVRVALLREEQEHWIKPGFQDQDRAYLAVNFRPIENLTIKFRYEYLDWVRAAVSPSVTRDEVTPWIDAGMPGLDFSSDESVPNSAYVTGTARYTSNNQWAMIVMPDGTEQMMNMRNFARGARETLITGDVAPLPLDFLPLDWNPFGAAGIQMFGGDNAQGVIQYKVNEKIHLEYAYNTEGLDYEFIAAGNPALYVDANTTLSDGITPNPMFGEYYVNSQPTGFLNQERFLRAQRLQGTFSHDFGENEGWSRWLGKHDMVLLYEENTDEFFWTRERLVNQTPLPGARPYNPSANNPDNYARIVTYVDPATKSWAAPIDARYFQDRLNAQPGVDFQWVNQPDNNTVGKTEIDSVLFVWQSRWWKDKIVLTLGWRRDEIDSWEKVQPIPFPRATAREQGYAFNPDTSGVTPNTSNTGIVFHALENMGALSYLSFFWNESDSFAVSNWGELVNGDLPPPRTGTSESYGFRFALFEGRLAGSFTIFDVLDDNNTFRNNDINNPMGDLFDLIGRDDLDDANRNDLRSLSSEGWEFQMTANLTRNWRVMFGVDHYETRDSNVAPITQGLIEQYRSQWLADPNAPIPDNENLTAQERYDSMMTALALQLAQAGGYKENERQYKATLLTNYKFTDGPLENVSIGGNVVWRDEPALGFPWKNDPELGLIVDVENPFYGDDILNVSVHAAYERKILKGKIDWKIQLNINNIGDEDPFVTGMVASQADPSVGIVSRMSKGNPQTWVLTNTFRW